MRLAVVVLWLVFLDATAYAHQSSVVYLEIAPEGREVAVTFQISNLDLGPALGVDRPVEKSEVRSIFDYLAAHVYVSNEGLPCAPRDDGTSILDRAEGFFAVAKVRWECKRTLANARLTYNLFFDLDPRHQGLATVGTGQHVFRGDSRELAITRPVTLWDHVRDYLVLGVEHIFTGYDHLAFLFGLLVVASWDRLRGGLRYVLGVVTAFTVAHSITLVMAGLGWVRLSPRLVEPAIALSIAYVAVENLVSAEPRFRWLLTFGFGLIHGFGFASVLRDIGLPPRGLVLSLLSFNVGVELGQLAVVALVAPILWLLARWSGKAAQWIAAFALAAASIALFSRFELPLASLCAVWLGGPLIILAWLPRIGFRRTVRMGGSVVLLGLSTLWLFERVLQRTFFGGWLG